MVVNTTLTDEALKLAQAGFSILPVGRNKRPVGHNPANADDRGWKDAQERILTEDELTFGLVRAKGIAVVGGKVSGGLVVFDFDTHENVELKKDYFDVWLDNISGTLDPDLLPIQQTGGGGFQAFVRCNDPVPNLKLARIPDKNSAQKFACIIETRGEGGYALIPPSLHPSGKSYQWLQGDLLSVPEIDRETLDLLLGAAEALDTYQDLGDAQRRKLIQDYRVRRPPSGHDSVFERFNESYTPGEILERNGYRRIGRKYLWPDSSSGNPGVVVFPDAPIIYSHHGDILGDGKAHDAFDTYAMLEHNGDKKAARAAAMRELGEKVGERKQTRVRFGTTEDDPPDAPQAVDPGVFVWDHGYALTKHYKDQEPKTVQLTNWIWEPTLRLRWPDGTLGERGDLTVNGNHKVNLDLPGRAWNGRKELLEQLGGYGAVCFTTNNADIAKIRQAVMLNHTELPTAHGVLSYGLHQHQDTWLELYENTTLSALDTPPIFYAGTPVDPGSRAHQSPPPATPDQITEARKAIVLLPKLISPHAALAGLGYAIASAFSPRITPHLGRRLPFLFEEGEREAGKTSSAEILLELATGHASARIAKAGGMTAYQYDLHHANANNMLTLLDEYRPDCWGLGVDGDAQLRKHHDLATKWRGTGKAAKNQPYELNAPTIILGEGFSNDAATRSRGVLYYIEKQHRGDHATYSLVQRLPKWAYASHLHHAARTTPDEEHAQRLQRAEALAAEALTAGGGPRIRYALTYLAYGLLWLQQDIPGKTFTDQRITETLAAGVRTTLEGGRESKTNLEMWLEQLGAAASDHKNPLSILVPASSPDEIILRVSPAIELVRRTYRGDAAISNTGMLAKLTENVEFAGKRMSHRSGVSWTSFIKGIKITLSLVPERCDVSALEYLNDKLRSS